MTITKHNIKVGQVYRDYGNRLHRVVGVSFEEGTVFTSPANADSDARWIYGGTPSPFSPASLQGWELVSDVSPGAKPTTLYTPEPLNHKCPDCNDGLRMPLMFGAPYPCTTCNGTGEING